MNKNEFLAALEKHLSVLPDADRKRSLLYFEEIIADRMEEGLSEEEVIAQMESPEEIAAGIINDAYADGHMGYSAPVSEKKRFGDVPMWLVILLAVLAAPIWLPMVVSAVSVILSVYVSIWAVIISLYATAAALIIAGIAGTVASLVFMVAEPIHACLFVAGISLFCVGLGILLVFPSVLCTRWCVSGTAWCFRKLTGLVKGGKQ